MSQKKVDAYKHQKANRQQIIKREKRILMLEKLAALVICIAALVWVGYSVYGKVTANQEAVVLDTAIDTTALEDYLNNLDVEEVEDAELTEESDDTEAAEDTDAEDSQEEAPTEESTDTEDEAAAEETADAEDTAE